MTKTKRRCHVKEPLQTGAVSAPSTSGEVLELTSAEGTCITRVPLCWSGMATVRKKMSQSGKERVEVEFLRQA